jgi:hypothetical protein
MRRRRCSNGDATGNGDFDRRHVAVDKACDSTMAASGKRDPLAEDDIDDVSENSVPIIPATPEVLS